MQLKQVLLKSGHTFKVNPVWCQFLFLPFHPCHYSCLFHALFGLLLPLICFHGSHIFSLLNFSYFISTPHWHFLAMCFFVSVFSSFPSHQSLQGMLASLHSELDIQKYLMKILLPHRVSWPFILSASFWLVCQ